MRIFHFRLHRAVRGLPPFGRRCPEFSSRSPVSVAFRDAKGSGSDHVKIPSRALGLASYGKKK